MRIDLSFIGRKRRRKRRRRKRRRRRRRGKCFIWKESPNIQTTHLHHLSHPLHLIILTNIFVFLKSEKYLNGLSVGILSFVDEERDPRDFVKRF